MCVCEWVCFDWGNVIVVHLCCAFSKLFTESSFCCVHKFSSRFSTHLSSHALPNFTRPHCTAFHTPFLLFAMRRNGEWSPILCTQQQISFTSSVGSKRAARELFCTRRHRHLSRKKKMGGPARTYKRETLTHSNVFRFATSITIIGTGSRQQTYAHNTHRFTGSTFAPSLLLCFLTHPGRDIYLNTATIHHSTELSRRELSRVEPAASLWCFAARFGAR